MEHSSANYRKKAIPQGAVARIMRREQARLYQEFARIFPPQRGLRILDVGTNGSLKNPEHYFLHHFHPYTTDITAAGLQSPDNFRRCYPSCDYVQVHRGEPLPFEDGAFDLVFCNAVIEHVGDRATQRSFLAELLRVGQSAFITTPNRWYPVELHTALPLLHYLPSPIWRRAYRRLGFEFFSREEHLNLLDKRQLIKLLPDDMDRPWRVHYHHFLGLPSNLLFAVAPPGVR